jgi:flagellar biosynthesis protein FlhG
MVYEFKNNIGLIFNQTKSYQIGQTITSSLIKLALKNNIPSSFKIKYLGNISQNLQIATTNRLRKLFYEEFPYEDFSYELEKISQKILDRLI